MSAGTREQVNQENRNAIERLSAGIKNNNALFFYKNDDQAHTPINLLKPKAQHPIHIAMQAALFANAAFSFFLAISGIGFGFRVFMTLCTIAITLGCGTWATKQTAQCDFYTLWQNKHHFKNSNSIIIMLLVLLIAIAYSILYWTYPSRPHQEVDSDIAPTPLS